METAMHGSVQIDARAERVGRMIADIFLAALFAMFVYGYLMPIVAG
jgi:hypothetical protein